MFHFFQQLFDQIYFSKKTGDKEIFFFDVVKKCGINNLIFLSMEYYTKVKIVLYKSFKK
jgi:hypothetical protein